MKKTQKTKRKWLLIRMGKIASFIILGMVLLGLCAKAVEK